MSAKNAVLGLVIERPGYGYDLAPAPSGHSPECDNVVEFPGRGQAAPG